MDFPDGPVLAFLKSLHGFGANWCEATTQNPKSLRRLVNGCTCGCGGDFTLTVKGEKALIQSPSA